MDIETISLALIVATAGLVAAVEQPASNRVAMTITAMRKVALLVGWLEHSDVGGRRDTAHMTDFERRIIAYASAGKSLEHVRQTFGWRPATFVRELHLLLDRADVEAAMPVEVHALQRIREKQTEARRSRRFAA